MKQIGIREFKNRATQIVREVHDECAEYVVTVDGEPRAMLVPYSIEHAKAQRKYTHAEQMALIDELAAWIGESWTSPLTAAEAVAEQRREPVWP